jgi:hypothetical protein
MRTKIAFLLDTLTYSGSTLNALQYSFGLKEFYNIDSHFIIKNPQHTTHDQAALVLLRENFPTSYFSEKSLIDDLLHIYQSFPINCFYHVTQGHSAQDEALKNSGLPFLVHMTGVGHYPWGLIYAYVSEWMSEFCSRKTVPFVPHIVQLPNTDENLRTALEIPEDSIVIGRLGGGYSWNIHFVNNVISEVVSLRSDIYFLLVNVPYFPQYFAHPRIKVFSSFPYDQLLKRKLINSCDAMLHARAEGESFGFAPAEFSIANRPVITYAHSTERAHISILQKRGIYYESPDTLRSILLCIGKKQQVQWNCYTEFGAEPVIKKFYDVFLGEKYHARMDTVRPL